MINCKVELKLRWTKYCLLSLAGTKNVNGNNDDNNIVLTIKDTKLYVPVLTLPAKDSQHLLAFRYFLESNFVGVNKLFDLVYSNEHAASKTFKAKRYYLPKDMIKNYNVIINEKKNDQEINSDIKQYEVIRKLTTGQGEDDTTGCLLDYDYVKNHYRLIAVDIDRQKKLDADPKAVQ